MLELAQIKTVVTTTNALIHMTKWLARRWQQARAKSAHIETLFGFLQDADFTTGNVPPDDIDSLKLFKTWLKDYFRRDREISYVDELKSPDLGKHLCTIAGPVDHPFSRYSMGYDRCGYRWQPVLPFIIPLAEVEARQHRILREWKGHSWSTYTWYIADRNGRPQFMPEADRHGVLRKDFFMLVVAPNTFTENAFYTGQKHMMIIPTHGLAQLAVKDILDSNEVLEQLGEIRKQSEYFQAIIEVPSRRTKHGYAPTGRFLVRAKEPLDIADFRKFARFQDWV